MNDVMPRPQVILTVGKSHLIIRISDEVGISVECVSSGSETPTKRL